MFDVDADVFAAASHPIIPAHDIFPPDFAGDIERCLQRATAQFNAVRQLCQG
ncbi:hypothetical protein [Pararhizobium sp.]|uniref:hypothetical protein n=1 Tax=Pararhizobium sp. TaxID=1977563 RepID=UPI003D0B917A